MLRSFEFGKSAIITGLANPWICFAVFEVSGVVIANTPGVAFLTFYIILILLFVQPLSVGCGIFRIVEYA
jgi:hypothetical protein